MKPITKTYLLLFTCLFLLAACQKEEDVPAPYTETVQLIISVPASASTRIGDPGTAVDEGADWNQLAVILAYTDNSKVKTTTITQAEFNALPAYNGNTNYKLLAIDAEPGTVNIYGVTYSDGVNGNPADDINKCTTNADVQALTISNDYASTGTNIIDYAKFVSVATGYYKGDRTDNQPAVFNIQQGGTGEMGKIPTMTLTRLAAKIDTQWDAADAYEAGYTDVKVTGFKYNGTAQGRLFPEVTLPTGTTISNPDKQWTFYNTSEISQRNGRVYHYTFPDGVSVPSVKFNITAEKEGNEITGDGYTLNFQEALKQATWYKVNATIKGITGSGTITLGDNSGTSVGGG